jgi:putative transposase
MGAFDIRISLNDPLGRPSGAPRSLADSPAKTSAISLVWAVLDRASAGWRGLTMTPVGTRLLQDLRRSLLDPPRELRPPPSTTSGDTNQTDPISAIA